MNLMETAEPLATDVVGAVKAATVAANPRPKSTLFSMTRASTAERIVAPLLGIYLGYAVVRLPEVFEQLEIPKGPMMMMLIFLGILGLSIPSEAWREIWKWSKPLRLIMVILGLAIGTAQIGIWPTGSYDFIRQRFLVAFVIFLCCLVLLRDRRCMRVAITLYVLCVGAVSYDVIHTYDPNAVILNDDGDPMDPEILAARPELRRLAVVGSGLDSNDFGAILAAAFPLALWLSVGNLWRRIFWTGIAGLMVAAVVPTQSRGSMLGFLAAATVIIGAGARGWRRWLTIALVAGGVGIFLMMATGIGAGGRFTEFSSDDYNISGNEGRMFMWRQGFIWMLKRPWGYGISNYPTYFGLLNGPDRAAHSSWVQYGMELGVAGLVTFVALCWILIKGLRVLRKFATTQSTHPHAKDEEILAGHMLAAMTGVLVTGTFLSNGYYPLMYMTLGLAGATLLGTPLDISPAPPPVAPAPGASSQRTVRSRRRLRPMVEPPSSG